MLSTQCQAFLISIPLLILLLSPILYVYHKKTPNKRLFSLCWVLIVVWVMRFVIGCSQPIEGGEKLSNAEIIFDSLVHTLQTFSMDEDYTAYTAAGKELLTGMGLALWAEVYGIVNSALGVIAPIMGGALLLDILAGFFPYLRLNFWFRRDKFVFSELNEQAVTLAEDLAARDDILALINPRRRQLFKHRPLFVFSDAYLDRSNENSSELYSRAKDLGAVCIKLDLAHLRLKFSRSVTYFLIHADSKQNTAVLSQLLTDTDSNSLLWPVSQDPENPATRIYVFGQDGTGFSLSKQVCANHADVAKKALIRPIPDKMNTAFNLMYEAPLFLPLLSTPAGQNKDLYVAIFGSDTLAQELFKTVFWCGQMHSVRLHITLVCDDTEKLERQIGDQCPEILPSCGENSELLRIRPFGEVEYNRPYCDLKFLSVSSDSPLSSPETEDLLKKTNYFIVSMGSDEENLKLTEQLRLLCARAALDAGRSNHPVIAPAVSNHNLAQMVRTLTPGRFEPYVTPFASMKEQYSFKHVFLSNFTEAAQSTNELYNNRHQENDQDDIYKTLSNTARCVHTPYKLYDLGLLEQVDLTLDSGVRYNIPARKLTREQDCVFAWTEHRRWNAFLRSLGFVRASKAQLDNFFPKTKSVPNKLHPCLVESQLTPTQLPQDAAFNREDYDYLDYVSMYVYKLSCEASDQKPTPEGLRKTDYKYYDYSSEDGGIKALMGIK